MRYFLDGETSTEGNVSNVVPIRRAAAGQPALTDRRGGPMAVVALAAAAPGAGCTMLATHVAVQAQLAGDGPVAVVDAAPGGALLHWWERRRGKLQAPRFGAACPPGAVAGALDDMRAAGIRLCVVDCGVGDADSLAGLAAAAGMVAVVSDAHAAEMGEAMALGRALSRQATIAYIVNGRSHSGEKLGNALAAMSAGGGWAAGMVQHADAFAVAMTAGRTVLESHAGSDAARDIVELWGNLRGILLAG